MRSFLRTLRCAHIALTFLTAAGVAHAQATYTTGSNIGRRDKSNVQNAQSYKKDPVSDAMGEDYGKGQPIKQ